MFGDIFHTYDIRGLYGEDVTEEAFEKIGNAFAQMTKKDIVIAFDSRISSESLSNAFSKGAVKAGKTIVNIGLMPNGCAFNWATTQGFDLAYITASHLAKEWNGMKMFHSNGMPFLEDEIKKLKEMSEKPPVSNAGGVIVREDRERVINFYVDRLSDKIKSAGKGKVIIDCGNGSAGIVVRRLFEKAGFDADILFEEPDGNFPNRTPNPLEDPLEEMRKRVGKYDFGMAFDGDSDRVTFMGKNGEKLKSEQASYIILSELLKTNAGKILSNVECSRLIDDIARKFGVESGRFRVGHTFLLEATSKPGIAFAAEVSGHFVIPMMGNFDDAISTGLYFAYALQKSSRTLDEMMEELPVYKEARIKVPCSKNRIEIVERLKERLLSEYKNTDTMDGVRVDLDDGWVLIRPSNTEPIIRISIEARDDMKVDEINSKFSKILQDTIKNMHGNS